MIQVIDQLGLLPDALAGQVAVVTGAGRGIGYEAALAMARLGARVVVAEIAPAGAATAEAIRAAGGQALFVPTDVRREESVASLADRTREAFGGADILINNAIVSPVASVMDLDVATFDQTLAVNLRGSFLTCKAFLPTMLERGRGVIVNMVSTDAMVGLSAYIASKQGLAGFSQSLAAEVGEQGVRVIALAPGFVNTPGLRQTGEQLVPRLGLTPEQFMNLALHPAYPGAMPAEDAGAATAYLVAALADELHGEVVTGYQVLERAGYLQPGEPPVTAAGAAPQGVDPQEADLRQAGVARRLTRQLESILTEIEAEFMRLPVFIRPMARNGFKEKAGQSVQDWVRTAARLSELLSVQPAKVPAGLPDQLVCLARYCEEVPAESRRFIKDQAVLAEISRTAAERVETIRSLISALEELK